MPSNKPRLNLTLEKHEMAILNELSQAMCMTPTKIVHEILRGSLPRVAKELKAHQAEPRSELHDVAFLSRLLTWFYRR